MSLLLSILLGNAQLVDAVCSITITGSAANALKLNVRDVVGATGTSDDTTATVIFGDQVSENGSSAQATFNLAVQGNSAYSVRVSTTSFESSNLTYKGLPVFDAPFIELIGRQVSGSGASANPSSTQIAPLVSQGIRLDRLTKGTVSEHSTLVASGRSASKTGSLKSSDNCVLIGMSLRCLNGHELRPLDPTKQAFFRTALEFRIFPEHL